MPLLLFLSSSLSFLPFFANFSTFISDLHNLPSSADDTPIASPYFPTLFIPYGHLFFNSSLWLLLPHLAFRPSATGTTSAMSQRYYVKSARGISNTMKASFCRGRLVKSTVRKSGRKKKKFGYGQVARFLAFTDYRASPEGGTFALEYLWVIF